MIKQRVNRVYHVGILCFYINIKNCETIITLEEVKNKYGKLVKYKIIKSNFKRNRVEMVFTRKG